MATSKHPGTIGQKHRRSVAPSRTPGPLGINDAADPSALACFGDTPGPLGVHDSTDRSVLACYAKESLWLGDTAVMVSPICVPVVVKPSKVAYSIPQPKSASPPLISDSDIEKAATLLGVEP